MCPLALGICWNKQHSGFSGGGNEIHTLKKCGRSTLVSFVDHQGNCFKAITFNLTQSIGRRLDKIFIIKIRIEHNILLL